MARFGRDFFAYAGADVLGAAVGLALSPVFTRLYSTEQYGAISALGAVWGFVGLAQFAGMDSAYPMARAQSAEPAVRARLVATASLVALASAGLLVAVFALVGVGRGLLESYAGVTGGEALAFSAALLPAALMAWLYSLLRYELRAGACARVGLIGKVAGSVLLVPALWWAAAENRLWIAFLVTGATTLLAAGIAGWEARRAGLQWFAPAEFERERAAALLRHGLVLVPAGALYAASSVLDRLLVTSLHGPAETATLALALRLGSIAVMMRTWFALVWDPRLMEWIARLPREELMAKLDGAVRQVARVGALAVLLAALWSEPLVGWLYPAAYGQTGKLVPWIAFGAAISALSLVAVATVTMAQKPRWYFPVYGGGLAANLAVGLALVPYWGAMGGVAGAVAGEIFILGAWIALGRWQLRNLPLSWLPRVGLLALAGAFVAIHRPGWLLPAAPWSERSLLTLLFVGVLGCPLLRQLRQMRDTGGRA